MYKRQTYDWARDNTTKTVALSDVKARYVKMTPKASVGNFFAASEIMIYKKDGTEGKVVGLSLIHIYHRIHTNLPIVLMIFPST